MNHHSVQKEGGWGRCVCQLLKELTACGIIPYYVFQCRPVVDVKAQFQVPFMRGIPIIDEQTLMGWLK